MNPNLKIIKDLLDRTPVLDGVGEPKEVILLRSELAAVYDLAARFDWNLVAEGQPVYQATYFITDNAGYLQEAIFCAVSGGSQKAANMSRAKSWLG